MIDRSLAPGLSIERSCRGSRMPERARSEGADRSGRKCPLGSIPGNRRSGRGVTPAPLRMMEAGRKAT